MLVIWHHTTQLTEYRRHSTVVNAAEWPKFFTKHTDNSWCHYPQPRTFVVTFRKENWLRKTKANGLTYTMTYQLQPQQKLMPLSTEDGLRQTNANGLTYTMTYRLQPRLRFRHAFIYGCNQGINAIPPPKKNWTFSSIPIGVWCFFNHLISLYTCPNSCNIVEINCWHRVLFGCISVQSCSFITLCDPLFTSVCIMLMTNIASKMLRPEEARAAMNLHHSLCAEQSSSLSTSDLLELPAALLRIPTHSKWTRQCTLWQHDNPSKSICYTMQNYNPSMLNSNLANYQPVLFQYRHITSETAAEIL